MRAYLTCLQHILDTGVVKDNRTETKARSIFGYQMRFNMTDGFPLLTTKRMFTKGIVHELLWFISGGTNIRPLVKEGVHIWTDWPLKHYNQLNPQNIMDREIFERTIIDNLEFADEWGELGPVYGKQWRHWQCPSKLGNLSNAPQGVSWFPPVNWKNPDEVFWTPKPIDQLQNVIDEIRVNPMSRRLIVSAWNVADIEEMAVSGLPPCHCFFQFNCRPANLQARLEFKRRENPDFNYAEIVSASGDVNEGHLHNLLDIAGVPNHYLDLSLMQRSADAFLGIPFNIASYALLLHMVAQVTNTLPGEFIHTFGDLHIYENHWDQIYIQLEREPKPLPTLILNPRTRIDDFIFSDVKIEGYDSWPALAGQVAV